MDLKDLFSNNDGNRQQILHILDHSKIACINKTCRLWQNLTEIDLEGLILKELTLTQAEDEDQSISRCNSLAENSSSTCDTEFLQKILVVYTFPLIVCLCLVGNCMNLLVYTTAEMRRSTTIKILIAKACVNMTFILFLSPLSIMLINNGRQNTWVDEPKLWSMWPFLLFSTNTSGTCAAWLTVMMTFERYLLVAHPVKGKQLSNNRNVYLGMLAILIVAIFLHLEIPIVREVETIHCPKMGKYFHREYIRKGDVYRRWDTFYYWSQVFIQMLIPDVLILIFTVSITYQLLYHTLPNYFNEMKQCVTRMTMATTACHLVLELPAVLVYAVAAIYGPSFINHNRTMCLCHALSNFGNQLNASICFLIYASCSSKYRSLLRTRCRSAICCLLTASENAPLDPTNNGRENGHRRRTRSYEIGGRSLIGESSPILTLNGESPTSKSTRATSLVDESGRVKWFLTPPTAVSNGQSKKTRSCQKVVRTNHEAMSCKASETMELTKLG